MNTPDHGQSKRLPSALYPVFFLLALLGLSLLLEGCNDKCQVTQEYVYYEPVFTTVEEIRASVELTVPQPIKETGKIYFKDGYLYVNEPGKGIHIIDNRNPSTPVPVKFLKIPGNYEMAIKGNSLYADSYVDIVVFDVSKVSNIKEINRLESVLRNYRVLSWDIDEQCCVITDFTPKTVMNVTESECEGQPIQPWGGIMFDRGFIMLSSEAARFNSTAAIAPGSGSGSGVGGSMARFTISGNHLYLLDGAYIRTVDIADETSPVEGGETELSWDIETIFPYKSNLFIGSRSGMHIMDISTPATPVRVSSYEHVRSCDPVVVDDNYAYVTLRSGTECMGFTNQLEVIDISNLKSPQLLQVYPMTHPHGLGIDDKTLFICDGDAGLKAFDATDVNAIDKNLLAHYPDINAFDVIPFNDVLMMIGSDGIFQYDYSNPKNIKLLSKIELSNAP
jgi:hypothetical protein